MAENQKLLDWWRGTFSEADKEWMVETFQPLTVVASASSTGLDVAARVDTTYTPLIRTLSRITDADAFKQLSMLSTWFSKPGREHCAIAFASKSMAFVNADMPILDRHFALANLCIVFYRWRESVPGALENAISACEACIAIHREAAVEAKAVFGVVPAHHCFRQLRIIEEKRGDFEKAIELCEQAKAGGWADDWDRDIARLLRKKAKFESARR